MESKVLKSQEKKEEEMSKLKFSGSVGRTMCFLICLLYSHPFLPESSKLASMSLIIQLTWGHYTHSAILLASLMTQTVKNQPAMQETEVWSLGHEDPLEKGMATHSNILAWRIPWTEEPGGLYCYSTWHGISTYIYTEGSWLLTFFVLRNLLKPHNGDDRT